MNVLLSLFFTASCVSCSDDVQQNDRSDDGFDARMDASVRPDISMHRDVGTDEGPAVDAFVDSEPDLFLDAANMHIPCADNELEIEGTCTSVDTLSANFIYMNNTRSEYRDSFANFCTRSPNWSHLGDSYAYDDGTCRTWRSLDNPPTGDVDVPEPFDVGMITTVTSIATLEYAVPETDLAFSEHSYCYFPSARGFNVFEAGEQFELNVEGSDRFPAYTTVVDAPNVLQGVSSPVPMNRTEDYAISWESSGANRVQIEIRISGRGAWDWNRVLCEVPDSGSFTVPKEAFEMVPAQVYFSVLEVRAIRDEKHAVDGRILHVRTESAWLGEIYRENL